MENKQQGEMFFLGIFIAIGLSLGGYFIGQTLYNAKVALNTAEAKGLAERRVKADTATWDIVYGVSGKSRAEIPALYQTAEKHQQMIIALLKKGGFSDDEIKIGVLDYSYHEYRNEQQRVVDQSHNLTGIVSVETTKVELVGKVRASISKLITKGLNIDNRVPAYRFTRLNEIKPDMLREATKNARIAATEFAENAGVEVGGIRDARQGSFYIRDVGEEYGDTAKIDKEVRVVTTITFYLTE
jgi:hypothetical protein